MASIKQAYKRIRAELLGMDPVVMKLYYKYVYKPKPHSLASRIDEKSKGKRPFYFLQIGGNDGFANDPIFRFVKRYGWKGIITEPQQDVFESRLKKTYRFEKNVILENLAIAEKTGLRKLYKIGISDSRWATGLASFNRHVIEQQVRGERVQSRAKREGVTIPENIDDWIVYEEVDCITIQDILLKHHFEKLDLLQIDTEGYDFEIIRHIDFDKLKPTIISFEHSHFSKEELELCESLLSNNGYSTEQFGDDTIAICQ